MEKHTTNGSGKPPGEVVQGQHNTVDLLVLPPHYVTSLPVCGLLWRMGVKVDFTCSAWLQKNIPASAVCCGTHLSISPCLHLKHQPLAPAFTAVCVVQSNLIRHLRSLYFLLHKRPLNTSVQDPRAGNLISTHRPVKDERHADNAANLFTSVPVTTRPL